MNNSHGEKMNLLIKWSKGLRLKLLVLGFMPVLALGSLSFVSVNAANGFKSRLSDAYQVRAKLIETAGEMDSDVNALGRWMWITYGMAENVEARNGFIKRSQNKISEFDGAFATYITLPRNPKIKELFKTVEEKWPLAKAGANEAIVLFQQHTPESNELAKKVMQEKMLPHLVPITKTMNEIKSVMHGLLEAEIKSAEDFSLATKRTLLFVSLICVVFCIGFAIALALNLTDRLTRVSSSLHQVSENVHSASTQIAASSEALSSATTEQASSLEETATSLEQITAMIAKATHAAKSASDSSSESQTKAERGKATVDQMLQSMNEISSSNEAIMKQVDASNQQMADIVNVIHGIAEKTKVINDIVFQTKLLSFNASVEAARAGENGKGFAVVAEEVGSLAQMSGNAAKEISDMLTGSISAVEKVVEETKSKVEILIAQGKQKVESGTVVAKQCADVLNEIVNNVTMVSGLSSDISSASQEQSLGVNEINKAMSQLDTVTQQNASTSAQVSDATKHLASQAEILKGSVDELVVTVEGRFAAAETTTV